jgi:putative endonuclease
MNTRCIGKNFEEYAANYLIEKGYKIIDRNFKCTYGEIDIIAKKDNVLCFIEVKARSKKDFGSPLEAVTINKQKRMVNVAQYYCFKNKLKETPLRFEAIGIDLSLNPPRIEHIMNIFA